MRKPNASFYRSAGRPDDFPRDGLPEVAFLGRSNVGKSSLLNALLGSRSLAKVSSTPGRTQTVNFFRVDESLYFADLPGYGYARVPEAVRGTWERLIRSYLEGRAPLALCVFLVDARHEPMEGDWALRAYLDELGLPFLLAATKSDKLGRGELRQRLEQLRRGLGAGAQGVLAVSASAGTGLQPLWNGIRAAAEGRREASRGH